MPRNNYETPGFVTIGAPTAAYASPDSFTPKETARSRRPLRGAPDADQVKLVREIADRSGSPVLHHVADTMEKVENEGLQALDKMGINRHVAWCAELANKMYNDTGLPGTSPFADKDLAASFAKHGLLTATPEPGDAVCFHFRRGHAGVNHVGLYLQSDKDGVTVVGGNQGHGLNVSTYPQSAVVAFVRPTAEAAAFLNEKNESKPVAHSPGHGKNQKTHHHRQHRHPHAHAT